MADIVKFLHSEYSDIERLYLIFQVDYKMIDTWEEFIDEAEKEFVSQCKFNQNLFEQYLEDSRHQTLSPELRKWLRLLLLGNRDPAWEDVLVEYETNGPGSDYIDPHDSIYLSSLAVKQEKK